MRTLGIDLSASDAKTASCVITWDDGEAVVSAPILGRSDAQLLDAMDKADCTAIDAPFGWPQAFLAAVATYGETGAWPQVPTDAKGAPDRTALRLRETDRYVAARARMPLSVSSDRIAVTAMRCAGLLTSYAEARGSGAIDRSGDDGVVEVYPAAALVCWSDNARDIALDPQGYKGKGGAAKRAVLLDALCAAAPWLSLDAPTRALCEDNDDALDALLSALVARAAALGLTMRAETMEQTAAAHIEGWIHLPKPGSLDRLTA